MTSKSLWVCDIREVRSSKSSSLRLKIATTMEMVGLKSENFSKLLIHGRMRNAFMIIYMLKGGFNRRRAGNKTAFDMVKF
jgi:hypothetical protein